MSSSYSVFHDLPVCPTPLRPPLLAEPSRVIVAVGRPALPPTSGIGALR
jgi:hypothetical protein